MKFINNKNLFMLLLMIIFLLFSAITYKTVIYYSEYNEKKTSHNSIDFLDNINITLNSVLKERLYSTIYIGTDAKTGLKKLENGRMIVDASFHKLYNFVMEHQEYATYKKTLLGMAKTLKYIRTKIDTLSLDYEQVLFETYNNDILLHLLEMTSKITLEHNIQFNEKVKLYRTFLNLQKNVNSETVMIFLAFKKSKVASKNDFLIWDRVLSKDYIPSFHALKDKVLKKKLNDLTQTLFVSKVDEIMRAMAYHKIGNESRIDILYSSLDGIYSKKSKKFFTEIIKKLDYIKLAKENIYSALTKGFLNQLLEKKDILIRYLIISLVLFILFIFLLTVYLSMSKDKKLFETTLKDIESVLNKEEQKELDALVASKKTEEIYAFLAKIIKASNQAKDRYLEAMSYEMNRNKKLFETTLKDIESVLNKEEQRELDYLVSNRKTQEIYQFLAHTMKASNKAKDLFLANMSHEIRTPLNGIVGFTELLKSTKVSAEQEEFISIIENSSQSLLSIVNDILDLSKIKADKIEIESFSFDPIEKFESSIESYAAKASEKKILFSLLIDPTLPTKIIGDPNKISQILINLISNAIKFTDTQGEVEVDIEKTVETDEDISIKFSVSDSGIGITAKQQETIFDEFSQADVSTSRKFGGTGLGLAISSKLTTLMGGELKIESQEGEGTTFYFILTFTKDKTAQPRMLNKMSEYSIALISRDNQKSDPCKTLKTYLEYLDISYKTHLNDEILQDNFRESNQNSFPDLIFIDQEYFQEENDIEAYVNLNVKIIMITTANQKALIERYKPMLDSVVYKPMNFTKTVRSLDILSLNNKKETTNNLVENDKVLFQDINILVAEDNLINQKLIQKVLSLLGLEVILVNNGAEALSQRKSTQKYDIIFMDIQMPVMNGMEATQAILEYEKEYHKEHIPIVALTANALSGDREKYMDAGMDGYLSKPLEVDKLKDILQEFFPSKVMCALKP